jgi:hypothetical protein
MFNYECQTHVYYSIKGKKINHPGKIFRNCSLAFYPLIHCYLEYKFVPRHCRLVPGDCRLVPGHFQLVKRDFQLVHGYSQSDLPLFPTVYRDRFNRCFGRLEAAHDQSRISPDSGIKSYISIKKLIRQQKNEM